MMDRQALGVLSNSRPLSRLDGNVRLMNLEGGQRERGNHLASILNRNTKRDKEEWLIKNFKAQPKSTPKNNLAASVDKENIKHSANKRPCGTTASKENTASLKREQEEEKVILVDEFVKVSVSPIKRRNSAQEKAPSQQHRCLIGEHAYVPYSIQELMAKIKARAIPLAKNNASLIAGSFS